MSGPTPAAVVLEGTDNGNGHAISIFRNFIIDSSWPLALPRTMASLDWSCYPAEFQKPSLVYILVKRKTLQRTCTCRGFTCLCRGQPPLRLSSMAVPIAFPQDQISCLASSFASALHFAGHFQIADYMHYQLDNGEFEHGENDNLINSFTNGVNRTGIRDKDGYPMVLTRVKGYNMLYGPNPAAVILEGTDNGKTWQSLYSTTTLSIPPGLWYSHERRKLWIGLVFQRVSNNHMWFLFWSHVRNNTRNKQKRRQAIIRNTCISMFPFS